MKSLLEAIVVISACAAYGWFVSSTMDEFSLPLWFQMLVCSTGGGFVGMVLHEMFEIARRI